MEHSYDLHDTKTAGFNSLTTSNSYWIGYTQFINLLCFINEFVKTSD